MHYPPCEAAECSDEPCTTPEICNKPLRSASDAQELVDLLNRLVADDEGDETEHEIEDEIHRLVLQAVASGDLPPDELKRMAEIALSTEELRFSRWYS